MRSAWYDLQATLREVYDDTWHYSTGQTAGVASRIAQVTMSCGVSRCARMLALGLLSGCLLSCESLGYYAQAAHGQLAIMMARQDIEGLLADTGLPQQWREKLALVLAVRRFAANELLLPVADSYSTFVAVGREHMVWNVFASPEFSTTAVNRCYPIAGCVPYRGYFSPDAAEHYAQGLQSQGYDVYVAGADAYSTLGWFDDPLPDTVLNRQDHQLAGLIFHELAHQLAYVQHDTVFNESFATTVEREGVRRWLQGNGQEELIAAAELALTRQQQFVRLVINWRDRFNRLYREPLDEQRMRAQKRRLQQQMRIDYDRLKQHWGGYGGYDRWFAGPLNNAQLSTVASYNELVPQFNALLASVDGDLAEFYGAVEDLAKMPKTQRHLRLQELSLPVPQAGSDQGN